MSIRTVRQYVVRNIHRRLLTAILVPSLALLITTCSWSQEQNVSGTFRAYSTATANIPTGQAASKLRLELQRRGITAEVVADSAGKRVFVSGQADAQSFATQYMRSLIQPPAAARTNSESTAKLRAYPYPDGDLSAAVAKLRQAFGATDAVRIGMDERTRQILVHAPASVQSDVQGWLAKQADTADRELASTDEPKATSSLAWAGNGDRRAQSRLRHISWQQLVAAVERMTPNRLTLTQANDSHDLLVTLPARKGQTELRITPASGNFTLTGKDAVVRGWLQAIQSIDQPQRSNVEATQLMPVSNVKPETITRTAQLLQAARRGDDQSPIRWGGDLVGIKGDRNAQAQGGFVELKEAKTTQIAQADNAPPDAVGDDQVEAQVPIPGEDGTGGALIGPVQIDFVEGLDSIIIRGSKPDVDRVIRIIEDIERLSQITEPKIELVPLQHVNSTSMAEMVTQVNTTALAARRGTVSITALVKPNSLLLIGRPESVDATIKLIKDLDQPVAPTTQFKIVRLKHMSATDAQLTIDNFFAERGGLGPVIQVQADFRSNSLIIYASPRDMEEVEQLILRIDVGDSDAVDEVRVFKLRNALAEELAPVLEATLRGDTSQTRGGLGGQQGQFQGGFPQQGQQLGGTGQNQGLRGMTSPRSTMLTLTLDAEGNKVLKSGILTNVRVAADVRANSLVVTAPSESMGLIAALVNQLDELPTSEAKIKVFTILNGDAPSLSEMLSNLFGEASQDGPALQSATGAGESSLVPLRFSVDLRTNSIIATGSAADLIVVESILLRLDEDDVTQRRSRVYRLQNAPALDVATAINEFLRVEREIQQVAPDQVSPFEQIEREVVVVPEVVSNSLIISSTPRYFEDIEEIVKELDEQPPMVLIQVLIAEVDLGYEEEVGVELGVQDSLLFDRSVAITQPNGGNILNPGFNFNNFPLGSANSVESLATREKTAGQALTNFALSRTNDVLGYGGLVLSASSESVNLLVRALRENRRLDILSRPQVMTLNNQPAFILVGQRVPYIQGVQVLTSGQTITPTEFENVGLVLGVTPRISPDGLVVMEIDAEKSELADESEGVPISVNEFGDVIRQPPIDTTVAQTTVSARSGQTVILGGLITKDRESVSRRVPYLADIPLVGDLFRYDSEADLRTELLIIMTPHIVRKTEDSDLLNQVESERMSWCLADVIDVHGETQLSSGGVNRRGLTQLVYPDLDPTGTSGGPVQIEEVPTPLDKPFDTPEFEPPKSSKKSSRRFTNWLSPKSKSSRDEPKSKFLHVTAPKDQQLDDNDADEEFIFGDSEPKEPPTPDEVSPASYEPAEKPKQDSRWTRLRKKLTFGR